MSSNFKLHTCRNFLISFSFIFTICVISSNANASCTTVNSSTTITTASTACYTWASGDLTIGSVAPSSASITPSDSSQSPITTSGNVGTLTNNGSIVSNNAGGGGEPLRILNNVTAIINNGLIQNSTSAFSVFIIVGTTSSLTNSGQIQNLNDPGAATIGVAFGPGVLTTLNNQLGASITNNGSNAIVVAYGGLIGNIINAGTIAGIGTTGGSDWGLNDQGSAIFNDAHMHSITNTGSIYTNTVGAFGIMNNVSNVNNSSTGSLDILNNAQGAGNAHGALTYTGALPTNYNIIINHCMPFFETRFFICSFKYIGTLFSTKNGSHSFVHLLYTHCTHLTSKR